LARNNFRIYQGREQFLYLRGKRVSEDVSAEAHGVGLVFREFGVATPAELLLNGIAELI
jgi:hypothetical protein